MLPSDSLATAHPGDIDVVTDEEALLDVPRESLLERT